MITVGCVFSVTTTASAATATSYAKNTKLVVTADVLNMRKGKSTNTKVIAKLKKGTKVTVQAKSSSNWVKVKTSSGKVGYVYAKYVKKTAAVSKSKKLTGVKITYYCACPNCNGRWASWQKGAWSTNTSSGLRLYNKSSYQYKYCAATPSVGKLGQVVTVKLNGKERKLKIVDRMGSSSGKRIDVFYPSHSGCYKLGVCRNKTVYVQ